jgi:SAM-dependent methyltransferase
VNGHTFDVAREGYVNLLRTKPRGDERDMLEARRRFLARGHYAPLSSAINRCVETYLLGECWDAATAAIVDAGCGEGYYLRGLQAYLDSREELARVCYLGVDISKDAVRMAARRHRSASFVVADIKSELPLADAGVRILLNVFAPHNPDEFGRVVAPGGLLVVVIPAPNHLEGLRARLHLLQIERDKQQRLVDAMSRSFELAASETLACELYLSTDDILDLVAMTPSRWHATRDAWERARALPACVDRAAFVLLQFRRKT